MKHIQNARRSLALAFVSMMMWCGTNMYAADPVPLNEGIVDPTSTTPGHGKSPVLVPSVMQEGNILLFEAGHAEYTLDIVQNGVTVYSVLVPSTTTQVVLPVWLEGSCELQLYMDGSNIYYYGYIIL